MGSHQIPPELDLLLQEEHAPWEAIAGDVESGLPPEIHLKTLLAIHPDDILRTLASQGVTKLGEFKIKSSIAFPAFKGSSIITVGSPHRIIDHERIWRQEVSHRAGPEIIKAQQAGGGWNDDILVEAFVINVAEAADPDKDGLLQPLLHEDLTLSLTGLLATPRGAFSVGFEVLALLAMAPFIVLEQGTLAAYGVAGWLSVWNSLDIATYAIQISLSVMHLSRIGLGSSTLSLLLALQCIFLMFRLQYFSRTFKSTRFSFLDAIRDVLVEIKYFFALLLIIMLGFASAFAILFRNDQEVNHFDTLPHAFLKIYSSQSGLDYTEMLSSSVPLPATLLNVAYAFIMGMVLVNLLVGIMSNALNRVTQHEALKLLLHKAQVIDELEATLPRWLEDRYEAEWYPRHIHVLRIDPDRIDRVDLDALWAPQQNTGDAGKSESSGWGNEQHVVARLDEIQAALMQLTAQMQKHQLITGGHSSTANCLNEI
ncbi:putative Transient receptor potential cation channel subfamily V member 3 [Nannochloris sp. 'desiccata']|nr:putative Transient receptor potential cation channel subfamily V member 3 [Chlorella desiccata (nom. nud.)]